MHGRQRTAVPERVERGCRATHALDDYPALGLIRGACWCEATVMWVTPADVRDAVTFSCGRPKCGPS